MKRKIISTLLAFHIIGAYAAPLLLTENNCEMFCCEASDPNCEVEQMLQVAEIDMTAQAVPCEISMLTCEVPVFVFITVAPIKTIDQNFEKIVYTTQEYDFANIMSHNKMISNLRHFQIPDPPPSYPAPLLI